MDNFVHNAANKTLEFLQYVVVVVDPQGHMHPGLILVQMVS